MKIRLLAFPLLAALAIGSPPPAMAQADDAVTKQARARFQEGIDHFDKGNYDAARASFLQAYALRRHPAVLLNLAQSCLKGNHPLDAANYFKQYLRDSTDLKADQRASAESGLAEARTKLGRIEVIAPAGTEIFVENDRVGTAPLPELIDAEPGPKSLRGRAPDGNTETVRVVVTRGERASAKFGASASSSPPPVSPAPASPAHAPEPPASGGSGPATTSAGAQAGADTAGKKKDFLAPPENWTPVIVGASVAVVGTGVAIAFGLLKQSAQEDADRVIRDIKTAAALEGRSSEGICSSSNTAVVQKYGRACTVLRDNLDKVDADATVANVSIVVAIVGAATAVGWYLFAPKKGDAKGTEKTTWLAPPLRGEWRPGYSGLSLTGSF